MTDWLQPIKDQVDAMLSRVRDPERKATLQRLHTYLERIDDQDWDRREYMRNYIREYRKRKRSNL